MRTQELIENLINIYKDILEKKVFSGNYSNYIINIISFLNKTVKNVEVFEIDVLKQEVIFTFFKLLLDASGLIAVTEGDFNCFKIGNTQLIGRKRDMQGIYKGDDEQIEDNMCSLLFQGWAKLKGFSISKDLRNELPPNIKACDFMLKNNILVECKRMHPKDKSENSDRLIKKALRKINNAKEQLDSTEAYFHTQGSSNFYKHIILDISSYGRNLLSSQDNMNIIGFREDNIEEIQNKLLSSYKANNITLCWSNVIYFDKKIRAVIYNTLPKDKRNVINYDGWTIEFYPSGKQNNKYKELRISSKARTIAWIKASWYSMTDSLIKWGKEEHKC